MNINFNTAKLPFFKIGNIEQQEIALGQIVKITNLKDGYLL